jgi:hypothetical protein
MAGNRHKRRRCYKLNKGRKFNSSTIADIHPITGIKKRRQRKIPGKLRLPPNRYRYQIRQDINLAGRNIRRRRIEQGLSRYAIGNICKLSPTKIRWIEKGKGFKGDFFYYLRLAPAVGFSKVAMWKLFTAQERERRIIRFKKQVRGK